MVTVLCSRGEDRIEIQRCDPYILQVIEVFPHAPQVAAFEAKCGWWAIPRLQVGNCERSLALGEAVRKNLVENCVSNPIRNRERHSLCSAMIAKSMQNV